MHLKNIYTSRVKVCKAISSSVEHNNCKCKTYIHTRTKHNYTIFIHIINSKLGLFMQSK